MSAGSSIVTLHHIIILVIFTWAAFNQIFSGFEKPQEAVLVRVWVKNEEFALKNVLQMYPQTQSFRDWDSESALRLFSVPLYKEDAVHINNIKGK